MLQALSRKNSWENSCLLFCSLLIMLIIDLKSVPAQGQAESQSKKTKGADKLGKDKKRKKTHHISKQTEWPRIQINTADRKISLNLTSFPILIHHSAVFAFLSLVFHHPIAPPSFPLPPLPRPRFQTACVLFMTVHPTSLWPACGSEPLTVKRGNRGASPASRGSLSASMSDTRITFSSREVEDDPGVCLRRAVSAARMSYIVWSATLQGGGDVLYFLLEVWTG